MYFSIIFTRVSFGAFRSRPSSALVSTVNHMKFIQPRPIHREFSSFRPSSSLLSSSSGESGTEAPVTHVHTSATAAIDISLEDEKSSGHIPGRYAMIYTCEVCELRSAKSFSKHAYHKGIVLVRCDGCNNLHMIADNLGWFDHGRNVEDILANLGRSINRLSGEQAQQLAQIEPKLRELLEKDEQKQKEKQEKQDKHSAAEALPPSASAESNQAEPTVASTTSSAVSSKQL